MVQVEVAAERKSLRSAGRSRALQGATVQAYFLRLDGVRSQTISVLLLFSFLTLPNLARPAAAWSFSGNSKAGQLAVTPASISFGNVPVGTNQTASVVLTNSGGSDLTITAASVSNSAFALSALAYPVTLAAGQTVSCTVTFAPQVGGMTSGSVSVAFTTQSSSNGQSRWSTHRASPPGGFVVRHPAGL